MGLFKNIKQGLEAAMRPPTPEEIEAGLQHLTPEQRAAYDANMARVAESQAQAHEGFEQAKALSDAARVLSGPAGDYVHGPGLTDAHSPEATMARLQEQGLGGFLKASWKESAAGFGGALQDSVGGGRVSGEIDDPEERARVAAEERAARDAARAPYLAADLPPIAISRLTTRGGTQIEEVMAWLRHAGLADRPDQVYGVYRLPDRISPTLTNHSEKGRVVEWDVVHEPGAGGAPTVTEVDDAWFPARQQWVARRVGEPSVLDEDLGVAYCRRAGVGPERCLGIARHGEFIRPTWAHEEDHVRTFVTGVHVLHPDGAGGDALARMAAEAPLRLAPEDLAGIHTHVLNWEAIAAAVHRRPQAPPHVPSPFPYLPSTPQELLRMYVEVVGVRAADCYGAQVTVDHPAEVMGRLGAGTTNVVPKRPCADGEERGRIHAAQHVVVTYRDTPAYAEGRQRWDAYQQQVLQARLERGTHVRTATWRDDLSDIDNGLLRAGATVLRGIDRIAMLGEGRPPPPFRYCWPLQD